MGQIRFTVSTEQQYQGLQTKDPGTFYYTVDNPSDPNASTSANLYIGTNLIGSGLTIQQVVDYLFYTENTFPLLTAGDITPKTDDPVKVTGFMDIQTTGGDEDAATGEGELLRIKGVLQHKENNQNIATCGLYGTAKIFPFYADSYVCTGMNLLNPSYVMNNKGISNGAIVNSTGHSIYYFPVVAGVWGEYGTKLKNNGYVNAGQADPSGVYVSYSPEEPSTSTTCEQCPVRAENEKRYYLPDKKGWMLVEYGSLLTATQNTDGSYSFTTSNNKTAGVHLAWSNYKDGEPGTSRTSSVDIRQAVSSIHAWGMGGIVSPERSVFDEIDLENGTTHQRIDRVQLSSLVWAEESTQVYSATIPDILPDGLWTTFLDQATFNSAHLDGNTLYVEFNNGKDPSDFSSGHMLYYEKRYYVDSTVTIDGTVYADDFGITYFLGENGSLIVPTNGLVEESFRQTGKEQLFNTVDYVRTMSEVIATALCDLDRRLTPIEYSIENGFEYLNVTELEVENLSVENLTVHGGLNLLEWIEM